ncbi:restriction endonuclease subunit S [Mannheimia sp. AT1]|uniref:Restriction endonuclease subunit S n=1 Tax=Mannheimia cairinae TaxID=3025936 RepID=A0ABT5MLH9_9PAST|nr:restriction endonuclease subunit S [Mannheimia cairinae]MDD0823045.1 restriction endonuclease subunit S [Mannheimia cairinae]MDD0825930.1 restriction endonuclease subunit S [Mannheimia cairinae]
MSDWKVYKLGELVEITSSKRIMRSDYTPSGISFFRSKEIIELNKGNSISTELFISKEKYIEIRNKFGTPEQGDMLLTSVGTLGIPYLVKNTDKFYFKDGNLTWFRNFSNKLNSKFLFYWISSNVGKKQIEKISIGSTQKALTIVGLKSLEINIPSIDTQLKIIKILDSLSQKIHLNQQTNQTLEQIAQAIFKSWFVDFDPVRAKADCLANGCSMADANLSAMGVISGKSLDELAQLQADNPQDYDELWQLAEHFPCELVENAEFGEVPKGWEVKKIGEVVERLKNSQKLKKEHISDTGETPVFEQGANILMGYTDENPSQKATLKEPIFIFGDHTCITQISTKPFSIYQNVIALKGLNLPTYWVYWAIKDKQKFQEYRRHYMEFIIKEIIVPDDEVLCQHFSNIVSSFHQKIDFLREENRKLVKIRDELLPKLLSGELLNE